MLHALMYKHPMATRIGVGVLHFCVNRFTGEVRYALWYPEGYREKVNVTHVDFESLITCTSVAEVYSLIQSEG